MTIAKEIIQLIPNGLEIEYLMDDDAFPYGEQPDGWLTERICSVCIQAVEEKKPALLVVACNTASTLALDRLRHHLDIPVVGVVPAIKVAAEHTTNRVIGLLATPATVKRQYTQDLIDQFATHCQVNLLGSTQLVIWAEQMMEGIPPNKAELQQHLENWLTSFQEIYPSHVVLGCTHFPLLKNLLETNWPEIQWIDSGVAIAKRVRFLLSDRKNRLHTKEGHYEESQLSFNTTSGKEQSAEFKRNMINWIREGKTAVTEEIGKEA